MTRPAIEISGLTKRFDDHDALTGVDLVVQPGTVLGYLGSNGAGKTTTIRTLMGQIRPTTGSATIAGLDCWNDRRSVHLSTGYLPGDFVADEGMTGGDYLRYLVKLQGTGADEIKPLAERFGLDLHRRIGTLSHGNRQKVGLVQAFMGRPELIVLDEPTSGLDPLMQREFVTLVREVRDEGRTVFLSSHILDEIDAAADNVAVLRAGRVVLTDSVAALRAAARRHLNITLVRRPDADVLAQVTNTEAAEVSGREVRVQVNGSMEQLFATLSPYGIEKVTSDTEDLEDLFAAYQGDGQ